MSEKFIKIRSHRIKKSNIKDFGITKTAREPTGLAGVINGWRSGKGFLGGLSRGYLGSPEKYLYVTTYQGDNYKFAENEIDIDKVMKQLENI